MCLIQNGQIVLAVEEERLCREKGYMGFPLLSLRYLKERFPEIMGSLDAVGLAGTQDNLLSRTEFLQKYTERVRRDKDKSFRDLYLRPIRQNIGKLVPDGSGADRIVGAMRPGVRPGDAAYAAMT